MSETPQPPDGTQPPYPAQPAQQPYTQPPYPGPAQGQPQPAYAAPGRPPKKRAWVVPAIIAAVVVPLIGCAAVFGLVLLLQDGASKQAFQRAEEHYVAAVGALDTLESAAADISSADPEELAADPESVTGDIDVALEEARTEIAAARQEIMGLDDGPVRQAYLESLDSMEKALGSIDEVVSEIGNLGDLAVRMEAAVALLEKGDDQLNAALDATNAGKWSRGKSSAQAAKKTYARSDAAVKEIAGDWHGVGLDTISTSLRLRSQAADQVIAACDAGAAGSRSRYDAAVDRYDDIKARMAKLDEPEFLSDPSLLLRSLFDSVESALTQLDDAERAHSEAVGAAERGDF